MGFDSCAVAVATLLWKYCVVGLCNTCNDCEDVICSPKVSTKDTAGLSVSTLANAMDVGNPSNFVRIMDLYNYNHEDICKEVGGATYNDEQIAKGVKETWEETNYLLDPHGACGYLALKEQLNPEEIGVFLETAHPAKFKDTIDKILGEEIEIPETLQKFMKGKKETVELSSDFNSLKEFLLKARHYHAESSFF